MRDRYLWKRRGEEREERGERADERIRSLEASKVTMRVRLDFAVVACVNWLER